MPDSVLHRHRTAMVIGLVAVLLAWGVGLGAYLAMRDDEDSRADYCATLIAITEADKGGDLRRLFLAVNPHVAGLEATAALAPTAVAGDWANIEDILQRVVVDKTAQVTPALDTKLSASVQHVTADSNDRCGTNFAL